MKEEIRDGKKEIRWEKRKRGEEAESQVYEGRWERKEERG